MPKKPRTSTAITISWESYKVLKDKAISEDKSIKQIVEDILIDGGVVGQGETDSTKKIYACPECEKEFDEKNQLRGHMQGKHDTGLTNEDIEELRKDLENV